MLARVAGVTLRLRQHKDELEWKMFIKQRNYEAIHSTANQKKIHQVFDKTPFHYNTCIPVRSCKPHFLIIIALDSSIRFQGIQNCSTVLFLREE